ncbi:RagB/SusD family nutrient uptake outer membrane protein [Algoriphagus sp. D3-2-R+10]|uniref:RagB/SusD family nutrient uptake outer membrane protein n=1 Tax=Algoriphagus aurantiacus TaxID=3103948 RepID=UPI002B3DFE8F|nr:RagB/SusD family nutrient uptake outer membrane protein [Algoriphagus sp. D3-2-R+10]MEB2774509.1 RagB/SusD family nutrient uptake outer membrane protein [Algoriphagus sp. D3-2-R+10]
MKNIKLKVGAIVASTLLMVAVSCSDDFLEIAPTGLLAESQLTSLAGLDASLIAAYSQVNGRGQRMASPSNWVWGSIRGGDANKGTDPGDFNTINPIQRFETDATNVILLENWNGLYEGVARSNNVLRLLLSKGEDVTDADVVRLSAQARFLRGHYYFQLKRNFNNVPYVDETLDYGTGLEDVVNNVDIWPMIEADFQYAADNLADTQSQVGRVNSWAAKAYLGKVYMYQGKFPQAKTLFDDVINNGVTSSGDKYGLLDNYGNLFRGEYDNNLESVWAYQSAAGTGSVNNANPEFDLNNPYNSAAPGVCCGFFAPSFTFVNSFRTNSNGLPLLDESYNSSANRVKNDMGVATDAAFSIDQGPIDPRVDHTAGRRGIPYIDWVEHPGQSWIRQQSFSGPYSVKKFVYSRTEVGTFQDNSSWTPGYTGINFNIIRFADVLLMAAEAEVETGGLEKARDYVNMVRTRAMNSKVMKLDGSGPAANYQVGLYTTPWSDPAAARAAVRFERKLELGMEGHRFYDLVRWGTASEELNAYLAFDGALLLNALGGATYTDKHVVLPIPQAQIDLLGPDILIQNPGF